MTHDCWISVKVYGIPLYCSLFASLSNVTSVRLSSKSGIPLNQNKQKSQIVHVPQIIHPRHDKNIFAVDDPEYQSPSRPCWWRPQDYKTLSKHYLYKHKEKREAINKHNRIVNGPYCGDVVSVYVLCRLACQIDRAIQHQRTRSAAVCQMKTARKQVPQRHAEIQDCWRTAKNNSCSRTISGNRRFKMYVWQKLNCQMA